MNSSKLWSALVLSCVACGSSFHSNDTSTGGDGSGDSTGTAGDVSVGGSSNGGGVASGGTGSGGKPGGAGSTGLGGAPSSGGTASSGGAVSSGGDVSVGGSSGGDIGIAGRASGGGSAGSNPSGGAGAASGAGGADCGTLWSKYTDLVAKAKVCDAGSTVQCISNSNIVDQCNCPVPVNHNSTSIANAKNALQSWKDAGCTFKNCIACVAQGTPACAADLSGAGYTCQATPIKTQ